jgi:hypothetical protein
MPSGSETLSMGRFSLATVAASIAFCFPAVAADNFETKEEAQAWIDKNVVVGIHCSDLLSLHSQNVTVAAVGEDMTQSTDNPRFVTWWMSLTTQYGKEKMCPLEIRAYCTSEGKIERIEPIPRECAQ